MERGTPLFDTDPLIGREDTHSLFLNRYSMEEMRKILSRVGLLGHLENMGFDHLIVDIFCDDSLIHYLRIFSRAKDPKRLLVDLRLSENRFIPSRLNVPVKNPAFDMFFVEWLQSQNPIKKDFSPNRPQLPGQKRPGLGCLKYVMAMMNEVSDEVIRDGFLDVPDHFHLAVMYSKSFNFFDPEKEGEMRALLRDLREHSLSDITWGVLTGSIFEKKTGKPYLYNPTEEIFSLSSRMRSYFKNRIYEKMVKEKMKTHYVIDMERTNARKAEILKTAKIVDL
jgi:hypothetical protein